MLTRPRLGLVGVVVVASMSVAACGDDEESTSTTTDEPTADQEVTGDVVVFAAASLTAAFGDIGTAFEAEHPGVTITFNFAGSSDLVAQIDDGAPADVFASADTSNMDKLIDAGHHDGEPTTFATNQLEIIVAPGNPEGIESVADLANPDLDVVTCAAEVPCGAYAAEIFAAADADVTPKSYEENVKAVVTKVVAGEADAGIVYRTDVTAAGDDADGVAIADDLDVMVEYPITEVADAENPGGAAAFTAFVQSDAGQEILAEYGFGPA